MAHIILGKTIECSNIKMYYWQPEPPKILAEIQYSEDLHKKFRTKIIENIKIIQNYDFANFDKDKYRIQCKYCEFNWFCNNEKIDIFDSEDIEDFIQNINFGVIKEIF